MTEKEERKEKEKLKKKGRQRDMVFHMHRKKPMEIEARTTERVWAIELLTLLRTRAYVFDWPRGRCQQTFAEGKWAESESSIHSFHGSSSHNCLLIFMLALKPGAESDTAIYTYHAFSEALSLAVKSFLKEKMNWFIKPFIQYIFIPCLLSSQLVREASNYQSPNPGIPSFSKPYCLSVGNIIIHSPLFFLFLCLLLHHHHHHHQISSSEQLLITEYLSHGRNSIKYIMYVTADLWWRPYLHLSFEQPRQATGNVI